MSVSPTLPPNTAPLIYYRAFPTNSVQLILSNGAGDFIFIRIVT